MTGTGDDARGDLDERILLARGAWPGIAVPEADLTAFLVARPAAVAEALEDLYIACACTLGLPGALLALEERYFAEVDRAIARAGESVVDEVKQRLRERLLVRAPGRPPGIAKYSGRGSLARWLKVAATREVLALAEAGRRERPADEELIARLVAPGESQELALLKREYRAEFKVVFAECLASLDPRQRTLLRYAAVDGLTIDEIGAIYGVHRATSARWIERIRYDLLAGTRERLMARIGVGRGEFESIMRLIQSHLEASMPRLLDGDVEHR